MDPWSTQGRGALGSMEPYEDQRLRAILHSLHMIPSSTPLNMLHTLHTTHRSAFAPRAPYSTLNTRLHPLPCTQAQGDLGAAKRVGDHQSVLRVQPTVRYIQRLGE